MSTASDTAEQDANNADIQLCGSSDGRTITCEEASGGWGGGWAGTQGLETRPVCVAETRNQSITSRAV